MMSTVCRCGATVVWAKKANFKPIALDAVAPYEGIIIVNDAGVAMVGKPGTGHFMPHDETCPQAKKKRQRR